MANQSYRLKEEQLRKEEEKLKEIELRVQREISEKRQELLAKEESLRNMEVRRVSNLKLSSRESDALNLIVAHRPAFNTPNTTSRHTVCGCLLPGLASIPKAFRFASPILHQLRPPTIPFWMSFPSCAVRQMPLAVPRRPRRWRPNR